MRVERHLRRREHDALVQAASAARLRADRLRRRPQAARDSHHHVQVGSYHKHTYLNSRILLKLFLCFSSRLTYLRVTCYQNSVIFYILFQRCSLQEQNRRNSVPRASSGGRRRGAVQRGGVQGARVGAVAPRARRGRSPGQVAAHALASALDHAAVLARSQPGEDHRYRAACSCGTESCVSPVVIRVSYPTCCG